MAQRVIWSDEAIDDLQQIFDYVARDSGRYAAAVVRRIVGSTRMLKNYPRSGRAVPEVDDETYRELLVDNYRVIYRLSESFITILTVAHQRTARHFDVD